MWRKLHEFWEVGKRWKTHAYLTDECTELTRGETIIDASEDGNGDYNVAEETSKIVKGVYPDWERGEVKFNKKQSMKDMGHWVGV